MVWTIVFLVVVFIVSTVVFTGVNFGNDKLKVKSFLKNFFFFVFILFLPSFTGYILRFTGSVPLLIFFQAYCIAIAVWFYFDYRKNYEKVFFRPDFSKYLYTTMLISLTAIFFAYSFNFFTELMSILKIRQGLTLVRKLIQASANLSNMEIGASMAGGLLMFYIPFIIIDTFARYLQIPNPVFKIWTYPRMQVQRDLDNINPDKLSVIELEVAKNSDDKVKSSFQIKAPFDIEFGFVFYKFINDYNYKFPETPFDHSGTEENQFGWSFYRKGGMFGGKTFIDPDLTLLNNKAKEYKTIVAERTPINREE